MNNTVVETLGGISVVKGQKVVKVVESSVMVVNPVMIGLSVQPPSEQEVTVIIVVEIPVIQLTHFSSLVVDLVVNTPLEVVTITSISPVMISPSVMVEVKLVVNSVHSGQSVLVVVLVFVSVVVPVVVSVVVSVGSAEQSEQGMQSGHEEVEEHSGHTGSAEVDMYEDHEESVGMGVSELVFSVLSYDSDEAACELEPRSELSDGSELELKSTMLEEDSTVVSVTFEEAEDSEGVEVTTREDSDDSMLELDCSKLESGTPEVELHLSELGSSELELESSELELDSSELELDSSRLELDSSKLELDVPELEASEFELGS